MQAQLQAVSNPCQGINTRFCLGVVNKQLYLLIL